MADKNKPIDAGVSKPDTDNPTGDASQAPDEQGMGTAERVDKQDVSNESNEVASGTDKR